MRILHFSDIHVGLGLRTIPLADWPSKRMTGGMNLLRGRRRHFAGAAGKIRALVEFEREISADYVLCTGDMTALATRAEFEAARALLEPLAGEPRFAAIPGNHDLYTPSAVRQRRFEGWFESALASDVPDLHTDGPWPLVRLLDEDTAAIAVNSARPNLAPWRSSGHIPAPQLEGLRVALADPRLAGRFIFLMTHYAPCRPDGTPDAPDHGLRNLGAFLEAARGLERGVLLCGHIHDAFRRRIDDFAGEVFCGGSATLEGRENIWIFDREADGWTARRGSWREDSWVLEHVGQPVSG